MTTRPPYDGSRALRDWRHETFAQEIARVSEQDALGKVGENIYAQAGYAAHRHNHVRLLRQPNVAKRIGWLRLEREALARAAQMPLGRTIDGLKARGIERFDDLIDRNASGVVTIRDFSAGLPVEIAIAALKVVSASFGIKSFGGSGS